MLAGISAGSKNLLPARTKNEPKITTDGLRLPAYKIKFPMVIMVRFDHNLQRRNGATAQRRNGATAQRRNRVERSGSFVLTTREVTARAASITGWTHSTIARPSQSLLEAMHPFSDPTPSLMEARQ